MKNFKFLRKSLALIIVFTICFVAFSQSGNQIKTEAATISQIQQQIEDLKKQQTQNSNKLSQTQGNISKEKDKQETLNNQIDVTNNLITALNQKIDSLTTQIADTQKKLDAQQTAIDNGVNDFKKRLRAMYLAGNDSYASIFLGSSDFFDMLMRLELSTRVAKHDNDSITELVNLKNEIAKTKTDLEKQKSDQESTKSQYTQNINSLTNLYSQTAASIQSLKKEEEAYKNKSAQLKAKEEEFEKELQLAIQQGSNSNNPYVGGKFGWPVPGYYTITSGFGPRWGTIHRGIDIAGRNSAGQSIYNKPIVAANSGTVITAVWGHWSYGNYVVIDHGGGYTTLYAHQNSLAVSAGQKVSRGQTIGYVGTTGDSTGYHCHFEVRINGVATNPMPYLS